MSNEAVLRQGVLLLRVAVVVGMNSEPPPWPMQSASAVASVQQLLPLRREEVLARQLARANRTARVATNVSHSEVCCRQRSDATGSLHLIPPASMCLRGWLIKSSPLNQPKTMTLDLKTGVIGYELNWALCMYVCMTLNMVDD